MPKFTKIFAFTSDMAPANKVVYVFQDSDDWFWLKKLVEDEGFATPFASIKEIELYLEMPLILKEEFDRDEVEQEFGKIGSSLNK